MAKKKVAKVKKFSISPAVVNASYQVIALLAEIRDATKAHAVLKDSSETVKQDLIRRHGDLLQQLIEGQRALAESITLLVAKGITKAKEKKQPEPTPQAIIAQQEKASQEMAAEQRAATAAAPAPTLKMVPKEQPAPAGDAPITQDQLRNTFLVFVQKHTREAGIALLHEFGAEKVSDLPAAQYSKFAARCGS